MPLKLTIKRIENENSHIRVFYLSAESGGTLPYYTAGAHIDVTLADVGKRSYSLIDFEPITDEPTVYRIAVQREDNGAGGSRAMHQLREGDILEVEAPTNDFELQLPTTSPILLLAGGIGVTPLVSMATTLKQAGTPFKFHYSTRDAASMAFSERLTQEFAGNLSLYRDDENALILSELFNTVNADTQIYLCGPRGMIDAAREVAANAGVKPDSIHIELFSSPESTNDDTEFEVELQSTGKVYVVPPGKSIIDVLEENDVDVMFDCRRGDCGICQTQIISGAPDHRDVVLSTAEKESGNVMQICVSRAKSARLVLDL